MKIKSSDLIQLNDNSNFTIFKDPFGNQWHFEKRGEKSIHKKTSDCNSERFKVENKIQAKRKIIELLERNFE